MWKALGKLFGKKTPALTTALVKADPPPREPYREPDREVPIDLMWNIQDDGARAESIREEIRTKTRRRAARYFAGKAVRHRVTDRKPDSIEFSYFRGSGKPLKIRWTNKANEAEAC